MFDVLGGARRGPGITGSRDGGALDESFSASPVDLALRAAFAEVVAPLLGSGGARLTGPGGVARQWAGAVPDVSWGGRRVSVVYRHADRGVDRAVNWTPAASRATPESAPGALADAVHGLAKGAAGDPVPDGEPAAMPAAPLHSVDSDEALEALLTSTAAGADLARILAGLDTADAADHVLVEAVAACSRLAAWAAAVQAAAAGELATRRAWSSEREHLGDELAMVMGHASHVGRTLVARGEALEALPEVRDALRSGIVDVAKTDVLAFVGAFAHPEDRRIATARVLPDVPRLGLRGLRRRMLAEAVAVCPDAVEANRTVAAQGRYVRVEPVENQMAYLTAYLPARDAVALWSVVDEAGHQISRAPGETRTLAQARADALVALTTGNLVPVESTASCDPAHEADPRTQRRPVCGDQSAGAGAHGLGVGVTSAGTGQTCKSCGARPTGAGIALHVVPVRPTIRVAVGAGTLLGLDDAPGEVAGYGPVAAEVARTLAEDATWRRMLTDPVTGVLTDYSTHSYAPGRVLRGAVQARDVTCGFPLCDRPAERCDLDHVIPFDPEVAERARRAGGGEPGQTRAANLHPLCRRHHRAKTHGRWRVERDPDTGTTRWTSPTGRVFTWPPQPVQRPTADPARDGPAGTGSAEAAAPAELPAPPSLPDDPPF